MVLQYLLFPFTLGRTQRGFWCTILIIVGGCQTAIKSGGAENAEYTINQRSVKLVEGRHRLSIAPESTSQQVTKLHKTFPAPDLNGDSKPDLVVVLTQQAGGSGTFYYVAVALTFQDGYRGSNAIFLGDRIKVEDPVIEDKTISLYYRSHSNSQAMSEPPEEGRRKAVQFDQRSDQLVEVANIAGEADPNRMTLTMKNWRWIKSQFNDGKTVQPDSPGRFKMTFQDDLRVAIETDCNRYKGDYSVRQHLIMFSKMAGTRRYCEMSQESKFIEMLENVRSYFFTSKGELILELNFDTGWMIFR